MYFVLKVPIIQFKFFSEKNSYNYLIILNLYHTNFKINLS